MSNKFYLGIDMGGTKIKIAIVQSGKIIEETAIDTQIKESPLKVIKDVVLAASKLKNYAKTKSIGVGIAGDVDFEKGVVRFSPNLAQWKNVELKKTLERLTQKKVFVDNDANTAAIGAFCLDAKGVSDNLVCITLGTGVGGGLIFSKKLYRGSSYTAGEIGHISIEENGNACNCGNHGCIETYVGAKYISAYAKKYLIKNKSKIIDALSDGDYSKITPELLCKAAKEKDKAALEIWNYVGGKLGVLLSNVINFVNPDTVVLCGGVSKAGKFLLDPAKQEMEKRAFKSAVKVCKIILSSYTHQLGVVGAAMLPQHSSK